MIKETFSKLFVLKTNNLLVQLIRYTFVGGFAFAVDFGLLYVLTEYAGCFYLVSATLSFLAGLAVNYSLSVLWIFKSVTSNKLLEFALFSLIGIVGLGFNDFFIWLFTEKLHLFYMYSKLIAVILVYLWNFFGRKYLVFNK